MKRRSPLWILLSLPKDNHERSPLVLSLSKDLFISVGAALLVLVAGSACTPSAPTDVTIRFHYSHFTPSMVQVRAGMPVTITLRNDDPIDHEWIVGSPAVHEVHRHGAEAVHDSRPTEVTVPALSSRVTTIVFPPGQEAYICHLPGHEEYGMTGMLKVL